MYTFYLVPHTLACERERVCTEPVELNKLT
jgi:hypothetical protein